MNVPLWMQEPAVWIGIVIFLIALWANAQADPGEPLAWHAP